MTRGPFCPRHSAQDHLSIVPCPANAVLRHDGLESQSLTLLSHLLLVPMQVSSSLLAIICFPDSLSHCRVACQFHSLPTASPLLCIVNQFVHWTLCPSDQLRLVSKPNSTSSIFFVH
jgi:hypothetical protein